MRKTKIFLDTDVILDLLTERKPHFSSALKLFQKIQHGDTLAYTSSVIFANLFYILSKHTNRLKAIQALLKLKTLVNVLDSGGKEIELALASDFKDFEDAIQYYTALRGNMNFLLTRNVKDYKSVAGLPILLPLDYLRISEKG